jgi:hypothetical protein
MTTSVTISNYASNNIYTNIQLLEPTNDQAGIQSITDLITQINTNNSKPNTTKRRLRVIGSAHSWSRQFDDNENIISLINFKDIEVNVSDPSNPTIRLGAGVLLKDAMIELAKYNLQLTGIPQAIDATVGGMLANCVHGEFNGTFSTNLVSASLIDGQGQNRIINESDVTDFNAVKCSLGYLGVIYEVVMSVKPYYDIVNSFEVLSSSQSTSYFNNTTFEDKPGGDIGLSLYYPYEDKLCIFHAKIPTNAQPKQIKSVPQEVEQKKPFSSLSYYGNEVGKVLTTLAFKVNSVPVLSYSVRLLQKSEILFFELLQKFSFGLSGNVIPSLVSNANFTSKSVISNYINNKVSGNRLLIDTSLPAVYLETEWSVDRSKVPVILEELGQMLPKVNTRGYFQQPILLRNVTADNIYLSPAHYEDGEDATTTHNRTYMSLLWLGNDINNADFQNYYQIYQGIMMSYNGRPHWGKLHNAVTQNYLDNIYPQKVDFEAVRVAYDPHNVFANSFLY